MLLQTLPFFGNTWIKDHNLISRFMRSVFVHKPNKPRYKLTWDVSVVLKYLKTLFPLHRLSLKMLTFKTVALLALANAPRAQTLVSLDLDNMVNSDYYVLFGFTNLLKTSRVGNSFTLKVEHFQDESLCAMHTLLRYIYITKQVRLSRKVFVSFVTFRNVTTSTIARWLKCVLVSAGIDTNLFKAHSFRGASVSAAFHKGCSLKTILQTADWTSDKNFRKYYCRHQMSSNDLNFNNTVLQM